MGRCFSPMGSRRLAVEAKTDLHCDQKTKFSNHLAEILAEQLQVRGCHRLIIAAPPATFGNLRSDSSDKVRATIVAELAHDLTKVPNHEMARIFCRSRFERSDREYRAILDIHLAHHGDEILCRRC